MNLLKIIQDNDLPRKEVANKLFPGNKYPGMALKRVIKEGLPLDNFQTEILAGMLGVTASELIGDNWKAKASKDGVHTFEFGEYTARLNTNNWITQLSHAGKRINEAVVHSKALPLSDYFEQLNKLIENYENRI